MTKAKFKGSKARFDVMYNYYCQYTDYFIATSGIVSVNSGFYPEKYWDKYKYDVLEYLVDIAGTENTWCSNLFKIINNEYGRYSENEVERFIYWFLVHMYRIDGFTDFKELKRRFRKDYKKMCKIKY